MRKILQIIPADGWVACYKQYNKEIDESQLVCWALVEDEKGNCWVTGLDADDSASGVDFADECDNFKQFKYKGVK